MIKILKNLFIIGLLGLVLLGCEESSSLEDQNWETFTEPNKTKAYKVGGDTKGYRLDDLGTTNEEDGFREIGVKDDAVFTDISQYEYMEVASKEGYWIKAVQIDDIIINEENGAIIPDPDGANSLKIDIKKALEANPDTLALGDSVAKIQFFAPEDSDMATPIGEFRLVL